MRRPLQILALGLVLAFAPALAHAQSAFVYDYSLGYVGGSLTTHLTLGDAQSGSNPLVSTLFPQRDLALYLGSNTPFYGGSDPTFVYSLTNWFAVDGGSSPSNTNVGFYQIADTDGASLTAMTAFWDPSLTQFSFSAAGGGTVQGCVTMPPQDCGRLWNGAGNANGGSFAEWGIDFTASFGGAAVFNAASGLFESAARPTSISGQLSGIFHDGTTNQYYRFQADLNQVSWAFDLQDVNEWLYGTDLIREVSTVPEPASMTLLATGLVGLAGVRRRRIHSSRGNS